MTHPGPERDFEAIAEEFHRRVAPEPPYGFDPAPIWPGGPDGDDFVAIRLEARRVELFGAPSVVWKAAAMPHETNSEKGRTP